MSKIAASLVGSIALLLLILAGPVSYGQITELGLIKAHLTHPFIIANTTLPPGHYDFHVLQGSDQQIMMVSNADGKTSVECLIRASVDDHTPKHTELIFDRYGKKEILKNIYEAGSPNGVAVLEKSNEEQRQQKQGVKPYRHTEEEQP